jgi:CRISPR-associated protein
MRLYWQSKIFALLHDPVFKPFHTDKSKEGWWRELEVMKDWQDLPKDGKLLKYLKNADYISAASDRGAIGNIDSYVNYDEKQGLEISHLLSGAKQQLKVSDRQALISKEQELFRSIEHETDVQKVFWWLWRCLPAEACRVAGNDNSLLLMPAETRIPDTSLWSHTSMTAALAGASIGYQTTMGEFDAIAEKDLWYKYKSHPYLVSFSFAPVQDLIKSSRKMQDFWAGSWILHYLSAKISWVLAKKYGADSLLYPSLFHQPLIDSWLLKEYPDFNDWIEEPATNSLLTAGFSHVLVLVLPKDEVAKAMQTAKQELSRAWKELGNLVLAKVGWGKEIPSTANCWEGWLDTQWQSYWTGLPIGNTNKNFKQRYNQFFPSWVADLNSTYNLPDPKLVVIKKSLEIPKNSRGLFQSAEKSFLSKYEPNIGSWWGYIFDATRINLAAVKNARNWQLPTVFSTRSTVSGIGAAVHNLSIDWAKESDVQQFWQRQNSLFNGSEQLNATEVVKRGLHQVLPELLERDDNELNNIISKFYPSNNPTDWYVLAAGDGDGMREWLKGEKLANYSQYVDRTLIPQPKLVELQELIDAELAEFGKKTTKKSTKLADETLEKLIEPRKLTEFLELGKRMGPSTHNALSRALLDFSNQLVPYLTETRYAGRLIYASGDDILAYTNLWEWDSWLWDTRQCFRGDKDPRNDFKNDGDYWQWASDKKSKPDNITQRPLFTMGSKATISFGIVIAHQSVPLAIALENLWTAEAKAKEHQSDRSSYKDTKKDAVQVRVMYQNGNILASTAKFEVFNYWRQLLEIVKKLEPKLKLDSILFEQAATVWAQHPAPNIAAIKPWCRAFCDRRAVFGDDIDSRQKFEHVLVEFMTELIEHTHKTELDAEMKNWLKLAAFNLHRRKIELGVEVK